MADTDVSRTDELHRGRFLANLIEATGVLLAIATLLWAGERFWSVCASSKFELGDLLFAIVALIGGVAAFVTLAGIAEVVRTVTTRGAAAPTAGGSRSSSYLTGDFGGNSSGGLTDTLRELAEITREVRDVSLLSEQQRQARLEVQCAQWIQRLETEVPDLLRQHDWVRARQLVQHAKERFPHVHVWDALETQVEQTRAGVESRDVEQAQRQVEDLTKLGAWDRVGEVVQELLARHPNSVRALDLQRRLAREQDKIDNDQRTRLMSQAQAAANNKEWPSALSLAQQLIQRFPRSVEADALRAQIPTLRENTEIYHRQQMEQKFRDLIRDHDYQAALRLAQDMIERYPNSPQAQVLRGQIGKLLERVTA